jgi:putative FmdB family regulatory protein
MPTYDYVCDACDNAFEEFQYMSEEPLKKCPKCKKNKLRRLIGTGAAIIFKGSGFYQTDYRSESYKSAAKSDAPPAPNDKPNDKKASSESKTDTNGTSGNGSADSSKPAKKSPKSKT